MSRRPHVARDGQAQAVGGVVVPAGLNVPAHTIRRRNVRELSAHRCKAEDAQRTAGEEQGTNIICLWFARGCCKQGQACKKAHRIPAEADEQGLIQAPGIDIFGRQTPVQVERSAWTLAANSEHRTLYVNYEGAGSLSLPSIRKLLESNFSEWGIIESLNIKHHLTVAFVTYQWRCSAEFAREAMDRQKLTGSTQAEVLRVRWSRAGGYDESQTAVKGEALSSDEEVPTADGWHTMTPQERWEHVQRLNMASAIKMRRVGEYPTTDGQYRVPATTQPISDQGTTHKDVTQQHEHASAGAAGQGTDGSEPATHTDRDTGSAAAAGDTSRDEAHSDAAVGVSTGNGVARVSSAATTAGANTWSGYGAAPPRVLEPTGYGAPRRPAVAAAAPSAQAPPAEAQQGPGESVQQGEGGEGQQQGEGTAQGQPEQDYAAQQAAWYAWYAQYGEAWNQQGWYDATAWQGAQHGDGTAQAGAQLTGDVAGAPLTGTAQGEAAGQGQTDGGLGLLTGYDSDGT